MSYTIHCPNCREEFEGEPWEDGHCQGCNEPYTWDEYSIPLDIEETDWDSFVAVVWINY